MGYLAAGEALAIVEKRLLEIKEFIASSDSVYRTAGLLGYVRTVNPKQADSIGLAYREAQAATSKPNMLGDI